MQHSQEGRFLGRSCKIHYWKRYTTCATVLMRPRGGFTMDKFGRRKTIMLGAFINLVGAVLQCAAQHLGMILVGRILAGWAVGLMSMSVPIYQSECAHPKTRGKSVSYISTLLRANACKV
jgi:MFS family permease